MSPEEAQCRDLVQTIRSVARADAIQAQKKLDAIVSDQRAALCDAAPWQRMNWYMHYRRKLADLAAELSQWPMLGTIQKRGNRK